MITIRKGNLLNEFDKGNVRVIVHQCNCFNNMGAGIAASIAHRYYPAARADNATKRGDPFKLGTCSSAIVELNDGEKGIVYNAYGQFRWGGKKRQTKYKALRRAFEQIAAEVPHSTPIGMPDKIGANRAGGSRTKIHGIIEEVFKDHNVTLYDLK